MTVCSRLVKAVAMETRSSLHGAGKAFVIRLTNSLVEMKEDAFRKVR